MMVTFVGTTIGNVSPALTTTAAPAVAPPTTVMVVWGNAPAPMNWSARVIVLNEHVAVGLPLPVEPLSLPFTGSTM
jgi:hypothetical protein